MKKLQLIVSLMILLTFTACNTGVDEPYTGYDDYIDKSDWDYQERPDSGGSLTTPKGDKEQTESAHDEDMVNTEDKDSVEDPDIDIADDAVYLEEPVVDSCESGEVSDSEKQRVLKYVNYIRSLHDLPPVTYNEDDDVYTAECSLVIAANKKLDHHPDSSWDCFTEDALTGCSKSNIYIFSGGNPLSVSSESIIDAYMTDVGVDSLGHRRWLIDPWLDYVSFARVDDVDKRVLGSAIKVINDDQQDISDSSIEFVAYPFEYYPKELFNAGVQMSFSVIDNTNSKWLNDDVDFRTAAITIIDPDNKKLGISGRAFDNDGYGVPNIIRWQVDSVKNNTKYEVTISNVLVNNIPKQYSYWFELN